jgi:response regulator RpfG family c-di-GMP phosphodiesterase
LTSKRAYREPLTQEDTLKLLEAHVGRLLDPRVFKALQTVVGRPQSLVFIDEIDD